MYPHVHGLHSIRGGLHGLAPVAAYLWGLVWRGRSCLHAPLRLTLGALETPLECLQNIHVNIREGHALDCDPCMPEHGCHSLKATEST